MIIELADKTFCISGRLGTMTKAQAVVQLEAAGARVVKSLAQSTDYFVSGADLHGDKLRQAQLRGIVILDEQQLIDLLAGRTVRVEAPAEPEPKSTEVQNDDVNEVRRLATEVGSSLAAWDALCKRLEGLESEALEVATDAALVEFDAQKRWNCHRNFNYMSVPRAGRRTPLFQPTLKWLQEILRGDDSPKFRLVRVLNLYDRKLSGKLIKPVLDCVNLSNVELLDLSWNKLPMGFYKQLGQAPQFSKVEQLRFENSAISEKATEGLAKDTVFRKLRILDLGRCDMSKGGVVAGLLGHGTLGTLENLKLNDCRLRGPDLEALAQADQITGLKRLDLSWNKRIDEASLGALLRTRHMAGLEALDLSCNDFGPWLGEVIGGAELTQLRELRLNYNGIDDAFTRMLIGSRLGNLESLDLGSTEVSQTGVAELLVSPVMANLRSLTVDGDGFDDGIADAVAAATHLTNLESIGMYGAKITSSGFEKLSKCAHLGSLRYLSVGDVPKNAHSVIRNSTVFSDALKESLLG